MHDKNATITYRQEGGAKQHPNGSGDADSAFRCESVHVLMSMEPPKIKIGRRIRLEKL